jgi:hypothetical protein
MSKHGRGNCIFKAALTQAEPGLNSAQKRTTTMEVSIEQPVLIQPLSPMFMQTVDEGKERLWQSTAIKKTQGAAMRCWFR